MSILIKIHSVMWHTFTSYRTQARFSHTSEDFLIISVDNFTILMTSESLR